MALNQPRRWLIAYDIRDPRRLVRVHKLLAGAAVPVQYSVFAAAGGRRAMQELAAAIGAKIDPRVDDVRFYPVPERIEAYTIGSTMLPDAAFLIDDCADLGPLLGRPHPAPAAACPSAASPHETSAGTVASARADDDFRRPQSESQP
jgi:CRISPR-associated protein Cas2